MLFGGVLNTDAPASQTSAQARVEIFAALWQLGESGNPYCANPRLLTVLRLVPLLHEHQAGKLLQPLRESYGRDRLIKGLVAASHGLDVAPEVAALAAAIDDLSGQLTDALGALAQPLAAAHAEMTARAHSLAENLTPAEDLAAMTGDPDSLRVAVLPSLFLPPPQTGRHGALVTPPGETPVAHLHFGYPLDQAPESFGITRYWVVGGGWHYAVDRFIRRHWAPIAAELRAMPDLERALTEALAPHRETVTWPMVLAEHVNIALKCQLSRRAALPELVHRGFARARGLAFFPWFDDWITSLADRPAEFVKHFRRLPQVVATERDALLAAATRMHSGPPSINLALANGQGKAVVVVPDRWDGALVDAISERWALVTPTLMRESHWQETTARDDLPVIAFGEAGRDALVDGLLADRGQTLDRSTEGDDLLVALVPPERAGRPWRMAVAVCDPLVAGGFAAEQALDLFHSIARFSGGRFIKGDGLAAAL